MQLMLKYALFAVAAATLNLLVQGGLFLLYRGPGDLYLALAGGTGAGLISKYLLDRRHVFHYQPRSRRDDARTFGLYTLTGVLTTALFWGTEIAFDLVFGGNVARLLGGACGLGLGYLAKYRLDRKYVFCNNESRLTVG